MRGSRFVFVVPFFNAVLYQIIVASVDEISMKFVDNKGKSVVITANIQVRSIPMFLSCSFK